MAVSRKAMTEGIRTFIFPGIVNSRTFTIPQSKIKDFCQLPLHKGAVGAPAPVRISIIFTQFPQKSEFSISFSKKL